MPTTFWPHHRDTNLLFEAIKALFKTNKPITRLHRVDVPKSFYIKLPIKPVLLRGSTVASCVHERPVELGRTRYPSPQRLFNCCGERGEGSLKRRQVTLSPLLTSHRASQTAIEQLMPPSGKAHSHTTSL